MGIQVQPSFFETLADRASEAIMPHFRNLNEVENKDHSAFDPVTVADKASERAMRAVIRNTFPDHGILGEEEGPENVDADHVWVLDPIDGTRAFITGLPTWGILIGLRHSDRAVMGMMVQPFTGERYFGDRSSARYSGPGGPRSLRTRNCPSIESSTVLTTSPALLAADERVKYDEIERRARLSRYGLDCYGYGMVAAGFADAVIETGLQPYDILALIPVVEGAGGRVTNWSGGPAEAGGQIVACGDPGLHKQLLEILNG